jgi:hypothetical protein
MPIMAGEAALFALNREGGEIAAALFANQGLQRPARAFGLTHERAAQYLAQAPVMAFAAGVDTGFRPSALYMQLRLHSQCESGVRLRDMMRSLGYPLPLRRLKASALAPKHARVIEWLSRSPATVLGRIIPERPGPQKVWLTALASWLETLAYRNAGQTQPVFDWAAEQMALAAITSRDVTEMADFVVAATRNYAEARFSLEWSWKRAEEEMTLWHDRLTCERMLKGTPFTPTSVIDLGYHPDELSAMNLSFVALRTPSDIAQEGTAMRHCVASYIPRVIKGDCHIVSMRRGEDRTATLEISRDWRLVQLKRRFNKAPSLLEQSAANFYAELLKARAREAAVRP